MNERRKEDNNGDWSEHRMFVTGELKRQGDVQTTILSTIQNIEKNLAIQETKLRNVSGVISLAVSSVVSLISGIIIFIIKRGQG